VFFFIVEMKADMKFSNEDLKELACIAKMTEEDYKEVLENIRELENILCKKDIPVLKCEIRGSLWRHTSTTNTRLDLDIFLEPQAQPKHIVNNSIYINIIKSHQEMCAKMREAMIWMHLNWNEFELLAEFDRSAQVIWMGRCYSIGCYINLKQLELSVISKKLNTFARESSIPTNIEELWSSFLESKFRALIPPRGVKTMPSVASDAVVLFQLLTASYRQPAEVSLKSGATCSYLPAFPGNHVWEEFFAWFYKPEKFELSTAHPSKVLTTLDFFVEALRHIEEATKSEGSGYEVILGQNEAVRSKNNGLQIRREPGGADLCSSFYNWKDLSLIVSTFLWNYEKSTLCELFRLDHKPWVNVARLEKLHPERHQEGNILGEVDLDSKIYKPPAQDFEEKEGIETPHTGKHPPCYHEEEEKQAAIHVAQLTQQVIQRQEVNRLAAPVIQSQERSSFSSQVVVADSVVVVQRDSLDAIRKLDNQGARKAEGKARHSGKSNREVAEDLKDPLLEILSAANTLMDKRELRRKLPTEIRPNKTGPINSALNILKKEGLVEEIDAAAGCARPRWKCVSNNF